MKVYEVPEIDVQNISFEVVMDEPNFDWETSVGV